MSETRKNILQRVEILFFKYGIKSVTMDDIARELGISKKTLYQFFENKNDLLTHVLKENDEKDLILFNECVKNSIDAIDELLNFAKHITAELSRLMKSQTVLYDMQKYYREIWEKFEQRMNERIYEGTKNNIERGKHEGLYREDVDSDIISRLYVSKIFCIINDDIFPIRQYDKLRLFKQHLLYHVYGIATPKGIQLFETRLENMKL